MNWYERMNKAIDHIEEHLYDRPDWEEIAKMTGQSPVNFQRTFSVVADISVFEYIRRRRLTLAAFALQNGNEKVIDVALAHGYDSPEAFARAFRDMHGMTPSQTRQGGLPLKAFPRITFLLSVKGATAMDYRIETKGAFSVYGIEGIFTTEDDKNTRDIPRFWADCVENQSYFQLIRSTGEPLNPIHAICDYRQTGGNTFPYMIFAYRTEKCDTTGYTEVEIPAATWAIFKSEPYDIGQVSKATQDLIKRVYTDWLPTAPYQKIDGYELELYLSAAVDKCYSEVWVRVEPK